MINYWHDGCLVKITARPARTMAKNESKIMQLKTVVVTGILYPLFNQDSENIVGVMLAANDDKEFEVESDLYMNELVNLCQEEVKVRGRIRFAGNRRIIDVLEYERVDDYRDDEPETVQSGSGYPF